MNWERLSESEQTRRKAQLKVKRKMGVQFELFFDKKNEEGDGKI